MRTDRLLRDGDVRRLLVAHLEEMHHGDRGTVIAHEFSVCRQHARIDVAVVNGALVGYEIKSCADRLDRLRTQIAHYNRVFDRVTVVCSPLHTAGVSLLAPPWYGIWEAGDASRELREVRPATQNPETRVGDVTELLYRSEMLRVLAEHGLGNGIRSKPRRALVDVLVRTFDPDELRALVREAVRLRMGI